MCHTGAAKFIDHITVKIIRQIDQRERFENLQRADVRPGQTALIGDRADDVTRFDLIAKTDRQTVPRLAGFGRPDLSVTTVAAGRPPIVAIEFLTRTPFGGGQILRQKLLAAILAVCDRRGDLNGIQTRFLHTLANQILKERQILLGHRTRDRLFETFDPRRIDGVGRGHFDDLDAILRGPFDLF